MVIPVKSHHVISIVVLLLLAVVTAVGCLAWLRYVYRTSEYRRMLPWGAQDVHEHRIVHSRRYTTVYLKARITSQQFQEYVDELELMVYKDGAPLPEQDIWLPVGEDFEAPRWWDPPPGTQGTWLQRDYRTWTLAKYADGYVYLHHLWPLKIVEHRDRGPSVEERIRQKVREDEADDERRRELILD